MRAKPSSELYGPAAALLTDRSAVPHGVLHCRQARTALVTRDGQEIRAAGFVVAAPGRIALTWPPVFGRSECSETVGELRAFFDAAYEFAAEQHCRFVQCLLPCDGDPSIVSLSEAIAAAGYMRGARVRFLSRSTAPLPPATPSPYQLPVQPSDANDRNRMLATIEQAADNPHDLPALRTWRTTEELLAGHEPFAGARRAFWRLFDLVPRREEAPRNTAAGVVLVNETPESVWEISYLGVVPACRRRRVASQILDEVISRARASKAPSLMVAVDDSNDSACRLYDRLGFSPISQSTVWLRRVEAPN